MPAEQVIAFYQHHEPNYEKGLLSSHDFWQLAVGEAGYRGNYDEFRDDFCSVFEFKFQNDVYDFLQKLRVKYGDQIEFWLLSNLNEIHYDYFLRRWPGIFASFLKIYLSFLMGCRKPDAEIYNRILKENKRIPYECAFVDDLAQNGDWPIRFGMAFHQFQGLPQLARWLEQFEIKVD